MIRPNPRAPDYGAMVWLNQPSGGERQVLFPNRGPDNLFAAVGHLGQYILVAPDQKRTVVRLGKTGEEERPALVDALADVVSLCVGRQNVPSTTVTHRPPSHALSPSSRQTRSPPRADA